MPYGTGQRTFFAPLDELHSTQQRDEARIRRQSVEPWFDFDLGDPARSLRKGAFHPRQGRIRVPQFCVVQARFNTTVHKPPWTGPSIFQESHKPLPSAPRRRTRAPGPRAKSYFLLTGRPPSEVPQLHRGSILEVSSHGTSPPKTLSRETIDIRWQPIPLRSNPLRTRNGIGEEVHGWAGKRRGQDAHDLPKLDVENGFPGRTGIGFTLVRLAREDGRNSDAEGELECHDRCNDYCNLRCPRCYDGSGCVQGRRCDSSGLLRNDQPDALGGGHHSVHGRSEGSDHRWLGKGFPRPPPDFYGSIGNHSNSPVS